MLHIMIEGCRFLYYSYFVLMFFSVLFSITTTYISKILIDILQTQDTLGGIGTPINNIEQLGSDLNFLSTFFINSFGGIKFLSTNIWFFAVLIIIFALLTAIVSAIRFFFRTKFMNTISKNLQMLLFNHIERLPYSKIKSMKNGDIIQTCTRDEDVLKRFAGFDTSMIVYTIFIVGISFVFLWITNYKIALVTMTLMPFMFIYSFFVIKEVRRRYRKTDDSEGEMTSKIEENLASVRLVKAFNNEEFEINDFEKYVTDYKTKYMRWGKLRAFFFSSSDIFVFGQIAITTIVGFILCFNKEIGVGTLYMAFTFVNFMVWPIRDVATVLSNLARANASLDRISLILDEPIEDVYSGITPTIKGNINFNNVSFNYPDSNEYILKNITFSIKEGQTVAIMGKTGSGKSTLAYLLTRLYDSTKGTIYIDGVDIKAIQKHYLRQNISIVLQDPFLFSKTIKDNVLIANQKANNSDLIEATSICQIHNSIINFPKGYDTAVGEKGTTLSGGQKQRVAIARTLILKSPVLVFDDSLSAVDTETDFNIRKAMKERINKCTTFLITHRVATAKDADLIIVLENGEISQIGKHEDLIKENGLYKRIYDIQTKMV